MPLAKKRGRQQRLAAVFFWTRELAKRTVRKFLDDDCMDMAASIAYYALFSIFPLLLGFIAILGLFLEPAEVQGQLLGTMAQVLPGSAEFVAENIEGVVSSRGALGVLSVVGLLWSATAIFSAVQWSLDRAWDTERERPFLKQKLLELGLMAGVGLLFLFSVAATALFRLVWQSLPAQVQHLEGGVLWGVATSLLPLTFSFGIFASLYRFVPYVKVAWRDIWLGASLAAVLFETAKNVFAWYLINFANYSMIYGSLGAVIGFLFWAYISALTLLLGAELAAEYSRRLGSHRGYFLSKTSGGDFPSVEIADRSGSIRKERDDEPRRVPTDQGSNIENT